SRSSNRTGRGGPRLGWQGVWRDRRLIGVLRADNHLINVLTGPCWAPRPSEETCMKRIVAATTFVMVCSAAALTGCEAGPEPTTEAPAALTNGPAAPAAAATPRFVDAARRYALNERLLPAHRVPGTKDALKADQFDDYRDAHPEYYAITEAPANIATVRPMVEWEPMRAVVMAVPSYMLADSGFAQGSAAQTFAKVARHAADHADVWFFVDNANAESGLKSRILSAGLSQAKLSDKVKFFRNPIDSVWFIDSGPLPIIDTSTDTWAVADFRYYQPRPLDDAIPTILGQQMDRFGYNARASVYRVPLSTEGGTFQSTTDGICFTGNRQLYYRSCEQAGGCDESIRQLPLSQVQTHPLAEEMRSTLADYVGCKDLIVTNSITDDGTGHIDMYMKVLDDNRVLMGEYVAPFVSGTGQSLNAERLDDNAAFIAAYVKPDGGRFTVERLVMPGHRDSTEYGPIPFTYINSTFINGINLWPATEYSDWTASRDTAQAQWDTVLPALEHVYIDSTELSFYSGAIHCVTRTIPALPAATWIADGSCIEGDCVAQAGGYEGACGLQGDVGECYGPAWECDCEDCESSCEPEPDACGGITYAGCCDQGDVFFCDQSRVLTEGCGAAPCGWSAQRGFYACGATGTDPSGRTQRSCPGPCEPVCDGRTCGDDGCGGSCGACDGDALCLGNQCRADCVDCTPGVLGCDGTVATLCQGTAEAGCNQQVRIDCADRGLVCEVGDCVESDETPDTTAPDTTAPDATETDTTETDTTETDTTETVDTGAKPVSGGNDGCDGSGGPEPPFWLLLSALGLALARRREIVQPSQGD
ncbi:MAG: agmatine/peptidylarginine deiminase, partial [Myxococcota bacterium]